MSSATLFEVSLYGLIADSSTTSSAVSRLRSLLDRCVGLCNAVNGEMNSVSGLPRKSLFEHHIAYIPALETLPGGSARNDDVQMRLSSTYVDLDDCYIDQEPIVIPLEKRDWNLSIYSPPEAPKRVANKDKVSMANFRSVLTARVQGDCLHHMETLRFKLAFEYLEQGYKFIYNSRIVIKISQIYTLQHQHQVESAEILPTMMDEASTSGVAGGTTITSKWLVQVSSLHRVPNDNVPMMSEELLEFASYLRGIVELQPTSHNDLAHKIVYENY